MKNEQQFGINKLDAVYWMFGGFVFVYIIIRAILISPYQDEIATFFFYIESGDFGPYNARPDANNHVVNSLLSYGSYLLFGAKHFIFIRLPNVLSFILLLVYLRKLSLLFSSVWVGFFFRISFLCSLYLVGFFSLSRGYGLSYAFLITGIYYLLKMWSNPNRLYLIMSCIMMGLALWSNLSLMFLVLSMQVICIIAILRGGKKLLNALFFLILIVPPTYYALEYSFFLQSQGLLYFGVDHGFYKQCVVTLLHDVFPGPIFRFVFLGLLLTSSAFIIYEWLKNRRIGNGVIILALFCSSLLAIYLSNALMEVYLPQGRALFHVYLLAFIVLFFGLDRLEIKQKKELSFFLSAPFITYFILSFNLNYTAVWSSTSLPYKYPSTILKHGPKDRLPLIASSGHITYSYNHYNVIEDKNVNLAQEDPQTNIADFIILNTSFKAPNSKLYSVISENAGAGVTLFKRNTFMAWNAFQTIQVDSTIIIDKEYSALDPVSTKEIIDKSVRLDVSCNLELEDPLTELYFVIEVRTSTGEKLVYKPFEIRRIHPTANKHGFNKSFFIERIAASSESIHMYFWSPLKQNTVIKDLSVKASTAQFY